QSEHAASFEIQRRPIPHFAEAIARDHILQRPSEVGSGLELLLRTLHSEHVPTCGKARRENVHTGPLLILAHGQLLWLKAGCPCHWSLFEQRASTASTPIARTGSRLALFLFARACKPPLLLPVLDGKHRGTELARDLRDCLATCLDRALHRG